MEFDHVGSHCAADGCNQRDFLPFRCDTCNQQYCLGHRSALAHKCAGAGKNDATSIDCPICSKSIRMTKSDNPDHVWETHFTTECSRVATAPSATRLCKAPGCRTALAPSNTFVCSTCGVAVCLPHRNANAHSCAGNSRSRRAAAAMARSGTATQQPRNMYTSSTTRSQPKTTGYTASGGRRNAAPQDPTNTLRGSTERRMRQARQQQAQYPPGGDALACPQCDEVFDDPVALINHSEAVHSAAEAADRCPHCSATFHDPVQLVEHVQNTHSNCERSCVIA